MYKKLPPVDETAAYHALIRGTIKHAVDDLKGEDPDKAMAFFLSDTCEAYCAECGIDYAALKRKAAGIYEEITKNIFK
jgi:hypothetical protein